MSSVTISNIYQREDVRRLLQAFRNGTIVELRPELGPSGTLSYPSAEKLIRASSDEVMNLLDLLSEQHILIKEQTDFPSACSNCGADDTHVILTCPNCDSRSIKVGRVIEHLPCINLDFEDSYKQLSGIIICPKCNRSLNAPGEDYLKLGSFYKCLVCGEFTARPKRVSECKQCNQTHGLSILAMPHSFQYRFNVDKKEQIERYLIDLRSVIDKIAESNWGAELDKTIVGRSGVEHCFSLVLRQNSSILPYSKSDNFIIVDFAIDEVHSDDFPVLAFFAKTLDIEAKNRILLVMPGLEEHARKLAAAYKIDCIEGTDLDSVTKSLLALLDSLMRNTDAKDRPRKTKSALSKRNSLDIMSDILNVALEPISKSELMSRVNLSFEQCGKYVPILEKLGLLNKYFADGVHSTFTTTEKGRSYLSNFSAHFGRIASGEKSVWSTKKKMEEELSNCGSKY